MIGDEGGKNGGLKIDRNSSRASVGRVELQISRSEKFMLERSKSLAGRRNEKKPGLCQVGYQKTGRL